ncbi:MAG: hypothetical protein ICV72_08410 [Aldersonia sp.]|nr:hypothetical protein [Aldersonia sp.]
MTTNQPLMPFDDAGSDREIDAADPGFGAPGSDVTPEEEDERAVQEFDARIAGERGTPSLFPTPDPSELRDKPETAAGAD